MRRLSKWVRSVATEFPPDRRGTVAIVFALAAIPAVAISGASVDYGRALSVKTVLQSAVDAAALAAASNSKASQSERIAIATTMFNASVASHGLNSIVPAVSFSAKTVTVSATTESPTQFMSLVGIRAMTVFSESEAGIPSTAGTACLLALNSTASDGIHVQGTNNFTAENCWAWANSTNAAAIYGSGSAVARAEGFCTSGGVVQSGNYQPTPKTQCLTLEDPYRTLVEPSVGSCNFNNKALSSGSYTLNPGVYCGGIDVKPQATVTFNPGIYIIKDGPLNFQAGSTASGSGIAFYFSGSNSTLQLKGGANINFMAPATGTLAGMLFVQNRASSIGATTQIQGGGRVKIDGVLYMPTQVVNIAGNGDLNVDAKMFAMVADRFTLQGNGTLYLKADYVGAGLPNVMPQTPGGAVLVR